MMEGWLCPRCKTVNAPFAAKCDCKDGEQKTASDLEDFMERYRKAFSDPPKPTYVPYPVYPQPLYPTYPWYPGQIVWCDNRTTSNRIEAGYFDSPYTEELSGGSLG